MVATWWTIKNLKYKFEEKTFCSGGNGETAGNLVDGATSALVEQVFNCPSSSRVLRFSIVVQILSFRGVFLPIMVILVSCYLSYHIII